MRGCGQGCAHLAALMRVQGLRKRRSPLTLCCELGLPVGFAVVLAIIFNLFPPALFETTAYTPWTVSSPGPVPLARTLQNTGYYLAIAPEDASAGSAAAVAEFEDYVSSSFPGLDLEAIGLEAGFNALPVTSATRLAFGNYGVFLSNVSRWAQVPALSTFTSVLPSAGEVE